MTFYELEQGLDHCIAYLSDEHATEFCHQTKCPFYQRGCMEAMLKAARVLICGLE